MSTVQTTSSMAIIDVETDISKMCEITDSYEVNETSVIELEITDIPQ